MTKEIIISFLFILLSINTIAQGNLFDKELIIYKTTSIEKGKKSTIIIKLIPRNESEIHLEIEIDNHSKCRRSITTNLVYMGIDSTNTINLTNEDKKTYLYYLRNHDGFKVYIESINIDNAKLYVPEGVLENNELTFKKIYPTRRKVMKK